MRAPRHFTDCLKSRVPKVLPVLPLMPRSFLYPANRNANIDDVDLTQPCAKLAPRSILYISTIELRAAAALTSYIFALNPFPAPRVSRRSYRSPTRTITVSGPLRKVLTPSPATPGQSFGCFLLSDCARRVPDPTHRCDEARPAEPVPPETCRDRIFVA